MHNYKPCVQGKTRSDASLLAEPLVFSWTYGDSRSGIMCQHNPAGMANSIMRRIRKMLFCKLACRTTFF